VDETLEGYDSEMVQLAVKQRMTTPVKKAVFCILMSSEDYLDAFEKLLRLNLKNKQDREIVHVLVLYCLFYYFYFYFYYY
jgi:nucleolar MIF4G domain-containing protein 1